MAESLIKALPSPQLTTGRTSYKEQATRPAYIVRVDILAGKTGRIVRPKGDEPWEAELLLVRSAYKVSSKLDMTQQSTDEPGTVKYYLVELPLHGSPRPTRNNVPISTHYLEVARSFDLLQDAMEAYNRATH